MKLFPPLLVIIIWIIIYYVRNYFVSQTFEKKINFFLYPSVFTSFILFTLPFIFIFYLMRSLNWNIKNKIIVKPKTAEIIISIILGFILLLILETMGYKTENAIVSLKKLFS